MSDKNKSHFSSYTFTAPFSISMRSSALLLELWLLPAECAMRSRTSARWLPRSQPYSAAVGFWECCQSGGQSWCLNWSDKTAPNVKVLVSICTPRTEKAQSKHCLKDRGFFTVLPHLTWIFSWISETVIISIALGENKVCPVRLEDCLWLSAERGDMVCHSCGQVP